MSREHTNADSVARTPTPPRRRWLKRIGVVCVVVVVGLIGLRWWWGREASQRLLAEINCCRAAGEPIFPNDFDAPLLPEGENAALVIREAAESLLPLPRELGKVVDEIIRQRAGVEQHRAEVLKIVETSAEARALIRKARSMPGADWGYRLSDLNVLGTAGPSALQDVSHSRSLARILLVAATHFHSGGNDAEAVETLRDALALAGHTAEHPLQIGQLSSIAMTELTARAAKGIAPGLRISESVVATRSAQVVPATEGQVRAFVAELLDDGAAKEALIRGMYGERMLMLQIFGQFGVAVTEESAGRSHSPLAHPLRPLCELEAARILRNVSVQAAAVREPTLEAAQARAPGPAPAGGLSGYARLFSSMSALDRILPLHYRSLADRRTAGIALAIRVYQARTGKLPETLNELVPDILSSVPASPYEITGEYTIDDFVGAGRLMP
ncbi:MAG: hypothetical protein JXQ73_13115 [Phycisphaerae bacterium]|nr:hypothetical protein [Phycisphaerae bacterium]